MGSSFVDTVLFGITVLVGITVLLRKTVLLRERVLRAVAWISMAAGMAGVALPSRAAESPQNVRRQPTNILILMADNWAWPHASVLGDPLVQTPTFDRLAREGVLFSHAFCSVPSCAPARAVFLTGQPAHRLEGAANLWGVFPAKFAVFPDMLEAAGYRVGFSGKGWGPGNLEASGRTRNPAGEKFRSFAEFVEGQPVSQPFCYWHSSREPHAPWSAGEAFLDQLPAERVQVPAYLPDHPAVREDIRRYYAEVQQFDADCGAILDLLRDRNLAESTLVVLVGDNGWQLPRGLAHVYDAGTRVPLAIRWPGHAKAGHVADELVSFEDIAPTLLEAAGLTPSTKMTGTSMVHLLHGETDRSRDHVFIERERHANVRQGDLTYPCRSIRTREFLYVWNLHPERWPAGDPEAYWAVGPYGDVDWSFTKDLLIDPHRSPQLQRYFELGFGKRPEEELYDLRTDPAETVNVAADPTYAATCAELRQRVQTWMRDTGDPRADGETDLFDKAAYFGRKAPETPPPGRPTFTPASPQP
jgi:arylsulfatase A-like enzyme